VGRRGSGRREIGKVDVLGLLDVFEKFDASDKFHGKKALGIIGNKIVQIDEVGMRKIGKGAKFFLETVVGFCIDGFEFFECNFDGRLVIEGMVDHTKAPFSEASEYFVAPIVEPTGILWSGGSFVHRHRKS
jgi:hypothetical protein